MVPEISSIYSFSMADILQGCGGVAGLLAVPDPGPGTPGVQRSALFRFTRSHPGQFFSFLLFSVVFFQLDLVEKETLRHMLSEAC